MENRERFYFPDASQISAMVGDHSRQMKTQIMYCWGRRRPSAMDFAYYQFPNLLGSSLCQIHNRENLGQISGDYRTYWQNLGWSAKCKIPDRLGFSRHMKIRL